MKGTDNRVTHETVFLCASSASTLPRLWAHWSWHRSVESPSTSLPGRRERNNVQAEERQQWLPAMPPRGLMRDCKKRSSARDCALNPLKKREIRSSERHLSCWFPLLLSCTQLHFVGHRIWLRESPGRQQILVDSIDRLCIQLQISNFCWMIHNYVPLVVLPFTSLQGLELNKSTYWFVFPLVTDPARRRAAADAEMGKGIPKCLSSLVLGEWSSPGHLRPWLHESDSGEIRWD